MSPAIEFALTFLLWAVVVYVALQVGGVLLIAYLVNRERKKP